MGNFNSLCILQSLFAESYSRIIVKNPPASAGNAGDTGSIPCQRIPEVENNNPLQYSCLENSMD